MYSRAILPHRDGAGEGRLDHLQLGPGVAGAGLLQVPFLDPTSLRERDKGEEGDRRRRGREGVSWCGGGYLRALESMGTTRVGEDGTCAIDAEPMLITPLSTTNRGERQGTDFGVLCGVTADVFHASSPRSGRAGGKKTRKEAGGRALPLASTPANPRQPSASLVLEARAEAGDVVEVLGGLEAHRGSGLGGGPPRHPGAAGGFHGRPVGGHGGRGRPRGTKGGEGGGITQVV